MAYERHGRRRHYYYKVRDGKTVRSIHVAHPLGRIFAGLAAARNAYLNRRRDCRRTLTATMHELKLLLGYFDVLRAALLFASGYYYHHGEWRERVRARLFREGEGEDPSGSRATPVGPASPAAAELMDALHLGFDPRDPDDLTLSDRLFERLGEVVALLKAGKALPGDLWVLEHARFLPLFDAWMLRAVRLKEALCDRVATDPPFHSEVDARTRALATADAAAPERAWDGSASYTLGLFPSVAAAAVYLAVLDHVTLAGYRGIHPGTYTTKQWTQAHNATRARTVSARGLFDEVVRLDRPHAVALVEAGDLVGSGGSVHHG